VVKVKRSLNSFVSGEKKTIKEDLPFVRRKKARRAAEVGDSRAWETKKREESNSVRQREKKKC